MGEGGWEVVDGVVEFNTIEGEMEKGGRKEVDGMVELRAIDCEVEQKGELVEWLIEYGTVDDKVCEGGWEVVN